MQSDLNQSYQEPACGAFGISLEDLLRTQSNLNLSFSERAWLDSKLDGCLPRMCFPPPLFPPINASGAEGFQYYPVTRPNAACHGKSPTSYAEVLKSDIRQKWT